MPAPNVVRTVLLRFGNSNLSKHVLECAVGPGGCESAEKSGAWLDASDGWPQHGNANALHRASRHTARLERATVLCMHSKHAKLGNATALHRASKHAARLQGATVLCMRSKHAKLGNANALHRASRHTARLERAIVLCMHWKHAKLCNATALHRASRHTARL